MKIKSHQDGNLPLNKATEISIKTTVVGAALHENKKNYPHFFR